MTKQQPLAAQVVSGGISMLSSQVIGLTLAFLAQRIILSTLTKEENGELFAYRRIADFLVIILCDLGLNSVAMRKMAQMPEKAEEILTSVGVIRLVMGGIAALLSMIVASVQGHGIIGIGVWAIYILISTRAGLLRYTLETPIRMKVRFGLVSMLSIVDGSLFLLAIWLMRDQLSISVIIGSFIISTLPSFITLLVLDKGQHLRPSRASKTMIGELFREALPMILAVILVNIHDKIDAFMLEWFSTPVEVGIFAAAYQSLAPFVNTIPIAAVMAIVPVVVRLASEDVASCRSYALTGLRLLAAAGIGVAMTASMMTPWIIDFISGGRYADNEGQFFAFLWMTFPVFLLFYIQEINIALGAQRKNIVITAILAAVTVFGGLWLIPLYASYGAIAAKFAAVVGAAAVAYFNFHRIVEQSITLRGVIGVVGAAIVCAGSAVWLPSVMPRPLAIVCGVVVWVVAVAAAGLVRAVDVQRVRSMFQRTLA